jgi:DNA-binding CsgD family transcriptional regulator
MEWFEFYGWTQNPFMPKSNPDVIGIHFTKKRILDYIQNGDICFLNGPAGSGKSSLLKWTNNNLNGYIPIHFSAEEITEETNLEKFLQRSTWQKIMKREFVLLLDESQESSPAFQKAMKLNWDKNKIRSIVIAQIEPLENFQENFQHRVGNRIIKLGKQTKSNIVDMLNKRIEGNNPLAPEAMEAIGEQADYNPRKVLEYAEQVCMKMSALRKRTINLFDVKSVFEEQEEAVEVVKKEEPKKVLELPKIEKPKQKGKKLSPLERRIVQQLEEKHKTVKELAEILKSSEGSIGKQLSKLTHKNKVVITQTKRPKHYGLIKKDE